MSWRKPTFRDLVAKLTQSEVDKFKASRDFGSDADPAKDILALTAESVRGFCRSNRQVSMCPDAGTIPEGLMSFAMDFAVFDLLKRINVVPNEARTKAWEAASQVFRDVAEGKFIPESFHEDEEAEAADTDANRAVPGFSAKTARYKMLNAYPMI